MCWQLRHLTLQNCVICPPPDLKRFDTLNGLNLCDVPMSSKSPESLISYNPLLEKLVLEISDTSNHIQINAPNLRPFDFRGCIKYITLSNVPFLSKLSLPCQRSLKESEKYDFDNFFQLLPALEHLYLECGTVQFLVNGAAEVPTRLSSPLSHLKRFNITLHGLPEFSSAFCLIQGSPYIQDIEMEVITDVYNFLLCDIESPYDSSAWRSGRHKVRMLIEPSTVGDYDGRRDKILAELTAIQCASRKAEVVVFDAYECYSDD
ncbi:hypothetical protein HAX54_017614 [Datura stramonium]|uniref:F-box/LRR-repeat protein 15/At3g58940/PEG3-like LRR domain-containing protein n=1 Tax=Datura stramonium TaxID=4076 RepID=A0ABS8UN92_DATST|nr:hypothetical protein [Datura stramonium]